MVQRVNIIVAKLHGLSSIPKTHMLQENGTDSGELSYGLYTNIVLAMLIHVFLRVCVCVCMCVCVCVLIHVHAHTHRLV